MKEVWIVLQGERGEGGQVVGVYGSEISAVEHALSTPCHFDDKKWKQHGEVKYWTNGCDFVCVEWHRVRK